MNPQPAQSLWQDMALVGVKNLRKSSSMRERKQQEMAVAATLCKTPACALSHHEHEQCVLLLLSQFAARKGLVTRMQWTEQLFKNSKNQDWPLPWGNCQTTEDGLQLCLQPDTGKKLQGSWFMWIWPKGGKMWSWAQCGEEQSLLRKRKKPA